jgi:hypothetical protein
MFLAIIIMFFGGTVFGLLWKRSLQTIIIISLVVALAFALYFGDWSFMRTTSWRWDTVLYMALIVFGYFSFFTTPVVVGTLLGHLLRTRLCKK